MDVVLDVLLDRAPHAATGAALWSAAERGECRLSISAHALTTVYYLASRARGARAARALVVDLLSIAGVAPIDEPIVRRALALEMDDFEDAVSAAAAEAAGCAAVVTRNLRDYAAAPLSAIDPATALAWLEAERGLPEG